MAGRDTTRRTAGSRDKNFLILLVVGLLLIAHPWLAPLALAQSSNQYSRPYYMPPPGKSRTIYGDDRIECSAKPPSEYSACMVARGNRVFKWSTTKSPAELKQDGIECAHLSTNTDMDQGQQEFDNCLRTRGDLVPAATPPASSAQIQAYAAPVQENPTNTCSNFAKGSSELFTECMANEQFYAQSVCAESTKRQEPQYTQCMTQRGFPVSAPTTGQATPSDQSRLVCQETIIQAGIPVTVTKPAGTCRGSQLLPLPSECQGHGYEAIHECVKNCQIYHRSNLLNCNLGCEIEEVPFHCRPGGY
jgi:hypothetical protein